MNIISAFMEEPALSTWEMVFVIFGGTLLFCTIVLSSYWYFQKRKRGGNGHQYATDDSVCDPILNGNTIQDIIEMTTSGSGSGISFFVDWQAIGSCSLLPNQSHSFNFSWSTTFGTKINCPPDPIDRGYW